MEWLGNIFSFWQQALFESVVQPVLLAIGEAALLEVGYEASAWLLVGLLQVAVLVLIIGPLQRWLPVDVVTDRATIRTDVLYTLIHRLGVFRVALFFSLDPLFDQLFGAIRTAGYGTFHVDQLWPGVTDIAVVSLLIYIVVFDFVGYWVHRGQHQFEWWWRLHSLHHAQRQMTMWSDNRNHLLDDMLVDISVVLMAQLIGVAPGQFIAIVFLTQLSESFQHANLRLWFGRVGERLWVSPRFHRLHHSIGLGHESSVKTSQFFDRPPLEKLAPSGGSALRDLLGTSEKAKSVRATQLGGHNFGVLLPWWDMLFKTANFEQRYDPTGIRDQVETDGVTGRDYGRGFWSQQWLGLKRLVGRA